MEGGGEKLGPSSQRGGEGTPTGSFQRVVVIGGDVEVPGCRAVLEGLPEEEALV